MTTYKTPGVYVQEISLFPPSVAEVATAIPAFIGYTEFAASDTGSSLKLLPTRIKALAEFEVFFGKGYEPTEYMVITDTSVSPPTVDKVVTVMRFYLYESLRLYFDNGGGDCYIVSVGNYKDVWDFDTVQNKYTGSKMKATDFEAGIKALAKYDEPTLILFPDAAGLAGDDRNTELGQLQQMALQQCEKLHDRFSIMDLADGFKAPTPTFNPFDHFRQHLGMNSLGFGAAYYPWVKTTFYPETGWKHLKFKIKPGTTEYDQESLPSADLDTLFATDTEYNVYKTRRGNLDLISGKVDLLKGSSESIGKHLEELQTALAAEADNNNRKAQLTAFLKVVSDMAVFLPELEAEADPDLKRTIGVLQQDKALQDAIGKLVETEKNATVVNILNTSTLGSVTTKYTPINETIWTGNQKISDIAAGTKAYAADAQATVAADIISQTIAEKLEDVILQLKLAALQLKNRAEETLLNSHPFFRYAADQLKELMRLVPPSGAIAGVYAATDRTRGVWKAPANISLRSVIGPAVKIDNREQEDMNVHTTGKSINAIRTFTGRGTMVWGARTLAGNDNEWRYVPVRRFFNMVEESVKKATEPFTFEPNDKSTWVKVKAMIENYLVLQWRSGALQGAKPEEAFFVHVGLGETMTGLDILEGRMIVEIGMAAVRPAEYIILRFSHKMPGGKD